VVSVRCSVWRTADGSLWVWGRDGPLCSASVWGLSRRHGGTERNVSGGGSVAASGSLHSSGFPARDLPSAFDMSADRRRGGGSAGCWSHAKPRSREEKRSGGGVVGGGGAVFEYEYEVGRVCVFRARARIPQSAIRNTIGRGCPLTLTPDPSPRWGRGEDFVLWDI